MKKCHCCSNILPTNQFYKNCKRDDGLQTYCKKCSNLRRVKYYKDNKEQEVKVRKNYQENQKQKYIEYKKTLKCINCNETRWYVLDFHHKNNDKEFDVSSMAVGRCSWEKVLSEIKKCDVLCANCHREKHFLEKQI